MENEVENIPLLSPQKPTEGRKTESEELGELFAALAKAQLEMEVAKTDNANPFFKSKYADLTSVVKASRPYLAKNGIAIIQRVLPADGSHGFLFTRLCHATGQWIESCMEINPPKHDIQSVGSYITYLRRYCYAAIAGVVSAEEDDDGEAVMQHPRKAQVVGSNATAGPSKITKAQLEVLAQELEGHEEILESLLKGFGISKLADMESKHYTKCIERIREIRRAKEE